MQTDAWHVELFNGPQVRVGETVIERFPTRHGGAILTMLALAPGRRISRDDIADTLWPDEALDASRGRIREHLYQLRNAIPNGRELILSEGDSISLSQAFPVSVDVLEYDKLLKRASETEDIDRKISLLVQADELYSGPFAPSLDWPRFDGLRTRYAALHLELLRALSLLFAERDFDRAIGYGKRAVTEEPLCEGAHEELIRLYARAGRPEDARRQYRDLEKTLKKDLDADPSVEIGEFVRAIPAAGSAGPLPRLLASLRIAIPNRRATRVYGAVAALSFALALVTLLASKPWRRPQPPPPTPEQRIAIVQSLRAPASRMETAKEREARCKRQADECLALGEEAWKAWWGPDEQVWIDRLKPIDKDIQHSLAWLTKHDPAREIQLAGALGRYWVFPESRLNGESHWLELVTHYKGHAEDRVRARALTGLSRYYLLKARAQAKPGLEMALQAYKLYFNCKDTWGQAHALRYVALHRHHQFQNVEALRDFRKALAIFKRIGNERGQAQTYECMTYIEQDSSGTVTASERLGWAISASRLYRKIKNPLGIDDGQRTLIDIAQQTPASLETRKALEDVEDECRVWSSLAAAQHDLPHHRQMWIAFAITALKLKNRHVMAEALPALSGTQPVGQRNVEYGWRLAGAYRQYAELDLHPENAPDYFKRTFSYVGFPADRAFCDSCLERGSRMTLEDAVRYAIAR